MASHIEHATVRVVRYDSRINLTEDSNRNNRGDPLDALCILILEGFFGYKGPKVPALLAFKSLQPSMPFSHPKAKPHSHFSSEGRRRRGERALTSCAAH